MPLISTRPAKSVCPPGGKPTRSVTGLVGQAGCCAHAAGAASVPRPSAAMPKSSAERRLVARGCLMVSMTGLQSCADGQ